MRFGSNDVRGQHVAMEAARSQGQIGVTGGQGGCCHHCRWGASKGSDDVASLGVRGQLMLPWESLRGQYRGSDDVGIGVSGGRGSVNVAMKVAEGDYRGGMGVTGQGVGGRLMLARE